MPAQLSRSAVPAVPSCRAAQDTLGAPGHLRSSSPRKGHQQNPARIRAADDQMRDAMCERARLAEAGAGDDEKRSFSRTIRLPDAVFHGLPLLRVQPIKVGDAHGERGIGAGRQVKQIRVLFAIRHRSVPRSERFSSLFPLLRQNQLAQNRLVGAFGAPGQPAVPLPDGSLLACYVLPGMSPAAAAVTLPR